MIYSGWMREAQQLFISSPLGLHHFVEHAAYFPASWAVPAVITAKCSVLVHQRVSFVESAQTNQHLDFFFNAGGHFHPSWASRRLKFGYFHHCGAIMAACLIRVLGSLQSCYFSPFPPWIFSYFAILFFFTICFSFVLTEVSEKLVNLKVARCRNANAAISNYKRNKEVAESWWE